MKKAMNKNSPSTALKSHPICLQVPSFKKKLPVTPISFLQTCLSAKIHEAMPWVANEQAICLVMDNAGGHGTRAAEKNIRVG
jgi:hypothetical protein